MGLSSILLNVSVITETFARAGGGGSSSDSGGSGELLVVLFGYIPMHYIGSVFRKRIPIIVASLIGWPIAIVYCLFLILLLEVYGFFIGIAALVGMGAGLYNWFNAIATLSEKAKKKQITAFQSDKTWDMASLEAVFRDVFARYQSDWSLGRTENMATYMTPDYLYYNQLIRASLSQIRRRNDVVNPVIEAMNIVDVLDSTDNTGDSFVMHVKAKAQDSLYDSNTNELLFRDNNTFEEFWYFIRPDGVNWKLNGIGQATEDIYMQNNELASFARSKGYHYALDWGWLLIPRRGQLFKHGKFGVSDINNHIVGVYENVLFQLYTYSQTPAVNGSMQYVIAQVAMPKSYGNIVVRKKRLLSFVGTKGLTRVSMEWGEFNDRYEVWASDMDKVTSFELLNPSFMVKLKELPIEVNIEVVDNIIYLYNNGSGHDLKQYEIMLSILQEAFKELRR